MAALVKVQHCKKTFITLTARNEENHSSNYAYIYCCAISTGSFKAIPSLGYRMPRES